MRQLVFFLCQFTNLSHNRKLKPIAKIPFTYHTFYLSSHPIIQAARGLSRLTQTIAHVRSRQLTSTHFISRQLTMISYLTSLTSLAALSQKHIPVTIHATIHALHSIPLPNSNIPLQNLLTNIEIFNPQHKPQQPTDFTLTLKFL